MKTYEPLQEFPGGWFSNSGPFFSLICTVISKLNRQMDVYQDTSGRVPYRTLGPTSAGFQEGCHCESLNSPQIVCRFPKISHVVSNQICRVHCCHEDIFHQEELMIGFITTKSGLVPLIEGLCAQI